MVFEVVKKEKAARPQIYAERGNERRVSAKRRQKRDSQEAGAYRHAQR